MPVILGWQASAIRGGAADLVCGLGIVRHVAVRFRRRSDTIAYRGPIKDDAIHCHMMKEREFWQLLEEVFGRVYGRSLSRDQRLPRLDDMTVVEALGAGVEPRVVWNVLCDQMDVPDAQRWGRDHNAPPMPAQ